MHLSVLLLYTYNKTIADTLNSLSKMQPCEKWDRM